MQNRPRHLPPFFLLPARSKHPTRSSLLSPSPLNALLRVVPLTLETTPEQLGPRWREDRRPHLDARGAQDTYSPVSVGQGVHRSLQPAPNPRAQPWSNQKAALTHFLRRDSSRIAFPCFLHTPSHQQESLGISPEATQRGPCRDAVVASLHEPSQGCPSKRPARHKHHPHLCSSETQQPEAALLPGSHFVKMQGKTRAFYCKKKRATPGTGRKS